jgi:hypothetical protein
MITNYLRCTREIKSRTVMEKNSVTQEDSLHQQTGLKLRKKLAKFYIWNIVLYGSENWTP